MEYRLGTEENIYENIELLQSLLNMYSTCFKYCQTHSHFTSTSVSKQYITLATELILSILTIWSEYSQFTEVFITEIFYKYCNSIQCRAPMLYLLSIILESLNHNDKTVFNIALKTLTSPFKSKRYERKFEPKPDNPMTRERKPLPILKIHHHEEFFQEVFSQNTPLLEFMLDSFLDTKSQLFGNTLDRFLRALFQ